MKIKLYYVASDNWVDNTLAGLYTEKEFEDLKEEIIKKYRTHYDYTNDIRRNIEEYLICMAALGREEQVKEFKEAVRIMEEDFFNDFIDDYVSIYEKEL